MRFENESDYQDYCDWRDDMRQEQEADDDGGDYSEHALDYWDYGVPAPGTSMKMGGW